jgi:Fe-S-cluster containining protein
LNLIYAQFIGNLIGGKNLKLKGKDVNLVGECNKCGNCCRFMRFYVRLPKNIVKSFYEFHGCKLFSHKKGTMIDVPIFCKHLKENGSCGRYTRRPLICRIYPSNPDLPLPEGCTLKWVEA